MEEAPNPRFPLQASGSCVIYSAPSADAQAPLDTSGDAFVLVGDGPQKLARECTAIMRRAVRVAPEEHNVGASGEGPK